MSEQPTKQKTFLNYIPLFFILTTIIAIYGVYAYPDSGKTYVEWFLTNLYIPIIITVFAYLFQRATNRGNYEYPEQANQERFVMHMSNIVRQTLDYSAEDFKTLRKSRPFQNRLFYAYTIYRQGEGQTYNYAAMLEGLDAGSLEYPAVEVIISEVQVLRERGIKV